MLSPIPTPPTLTKPSELPISVKLEVVHPSLVPKLWPLIEHLIKSICDSTSGRMSVSDVYRFILNKDILLWCAFDKEIEAIGLTEIRNHPQKKMLCILGVTGKDMKNWNHFMPLMEKYAKLEGCAGMESIARSGWLKLLKPQGWESEHIHIEKMFEPKFAPVS